MAVTVTDDGPVRLVQLDRPDVRNAVDGEHARLLAGAFADFDADPALAVAVLHGTGGAFCAGADLKAVAEDRMPAAPPGEGLPAMGPTRLRLGKPVIAAVEGPAVAGGLELALWCDLRVASATAVFGVYCRRWGVPLIDGGTVRLPRLVGQSVAMDMVLTGRAVEADEALRVGLANRLVPAGEGPAGRAGAGPRAVRAAAGMPARRPAVAARAVGPRAGGGDGKRVGARCPGTAGGPWRGVAVRRRRRAARESGGRLTAPSTGAFAGAVPDYRQGRP